MTAVLQTAGEVTDRLRRPVGAGHVSVERRSWGIRGHWLLALGLVRLRSLLTMTDLGLELITGEEELDRFLRWVVTQDLPDPSRYLSGGELVLTGMQWRTGPDDSDTFVAALARAKVAALATGDARYGAPPQDVIDACRKYRVPLFRVPEQVAFATVTERITRLLSTGRAADLTAILDRHRQLVSG